MKMAAYLIVVSILVQQGLFYFQINHTVLQKYAAHWVVWIPVAIFWGLYLFVPVVFVRPLNTINYLKACSKGGWLFVVAAILWVNIYYIACVKNGVPVSWNAIQETFEKGRKQEWLERNSKP